MLRFPVTLLYNRYANPPLGERVPGVPFPVSEHRGLLDSHYFPRKSPLCGQFMLKYLVVGHVVQARTARLRKARKDKFPKLASGHEIARKPSSCGKRTTYH